MIIKCGDCYAPLYLADYAKTVLRGTIGKMDPNLIFEFLLTNSQWEFNKLIKDNKQFSKFIKSSWKACDKIAKSEEERNEIMEEYYSRITNCILMERWDKNRVVYSFSPDLTDTVQHKKNCAYDQQLLDKLPTETFIIDLFKIKPLLNLPEGNLYEPQKLIEVPNFVVVTKYEDMLVFGIAWRVKNVFISFEEISVRQKDIANVKRNSYLDFLLCMLTYAVSDEVKKEENVELSNMFNQTKPFRKNKISIWDCSI